ncbi:hypothetical protein ABBQ32_009499 [Trebouxia sp. C0010 RCD-2024]
MGFALVPLLVAALLCEPTTASLLQRPSVPSAGPAFVWGSIPVWQTDGEQASRVIYEDTDSKRLADNLLRTLSRQQSADESEANATALLVYVGNKLLLQDLSASPAASAVQPLRDSLKSASSSVSIPNLLHQGTQELGASLVTHLQGKVASIHTAGKCSATAQDKEDAAQVVQRLSNDKSAGYKVLVVCGDAAGSLEDEMKSVVAFSKALSATFGWYVTAYMSDTASQEGKAGAASRALLQSFELPSDSILQLPGRQAGNQAGFLCDDKCFTQVRVIEVVILFATLLTALLSGICMMHVLGVPSKFETMKDARQES